MILKKKAETQEQTGSFKYDDVYDDIIAEL